MERVHGVTLHWGILLVVYLALLFATTMVMLTSGTNEAAFIVIAIAGVPIYLIASRAILSEQKAMSGEEKMDGKVVPFPDPKAKSTPDIAETTARGRAPNLRKLG